MSIIDGYELDDLRDKAARTERAEAAMENKAIVTRELKAEIERLHGIEKAALEAANIYETQIERLRATILDACKVFDHYDLPEHAFHYRREVLGPGSG